MRILVTGAAGQVGSHVIDRLLDRGDSVWGIDNFATGRAEHLPSGENFHFLEGSIANEAVIATLFREAQPQVVVHTAASYKDPDDWSGDVTTNLLGMINLTKASRSHDVRRIIYFQTALIYGVHPEENPVPLTHPRRYDNSSYAISKGAAEDYLSLSGIPYVCFRLANVVGDRCVSGPLPIFFERLDSGKPCFVTPARRDFVFVDDLARVVVRAIDGEGDGAYHFSSGTDVSIRQLYNAVAEALALTEIPEPETRELSPDDAPSILLDPSRTIEDFGNLQFTDLRTTAEAAVKYYREFGVVGGYTHLGADHK